MKKAGLVLAVCLGVYFGNCRIAAAEDVVNSTSTVGVSTASVEWPDYKNNYFLMGNQDVVVYQRDRDGEFGNKYVVEYGVLIGRAKIYFDDPAEQNVVILEYTILNHVDVARVMIVKDGEKGGKIKKVSIFKNDKWIEARPETGISFHLLDAERAVGKGEMDGALITTAPMEKEGPPVEVELKNNGF